MTASMQLAASLPFLGYKQRNAVLDSYFYDTTGLTLEERAKLSPLVDNEGSIVVVPPSNSDRPIRHYKSPLRFINKEGRTIRAIAVAGVGNSVLGTAALARSIADALDTDVAGIVTGYGLSDLMTDAFGGWFVFGAADRIRYAMEKFVERTGSTMPADNVTGASSAKALWLDRSSLPGDDDIATLSDILEARPPKLDYLIAHSKGAVVVSQALQHYVEDRQGDESSLPMQLRIITLGAVVEMPPEFKQVKQYLGALDWFGSVNSKLSVTHERVPDASHHLNQRLPYHLDVASLVKVNGAPRLLAKPGNGEMAPVSVPKAMAPIVKMPRPAPSVAAKPVPPVSKSAVKKTVRNAPPEAAKPTPLASGPKPEATMRPVTKVAAKTVRAAPKKSAEAPRAPRAKPVSASTPARRPARKSKT
ncbi:MAG: hypothetical protein WBB50_05850 [Methyloceanibacter sp.]